MKKYDNVNLFTSFTFIFSRGKVLDPSIANN